MEGNALVGVINQAFEKYGRHNNRKDSGIRIINTSQFWEGVISNFFGDTFELCMLTKTLESPLDSKEIKPVNPKGNQLRIFIGKTDAEAEAPALWWPDAKSLLVWKDPDDGKDWGQEKKGTTEDKMAGWHH